MKWFLMLPLWMVVNLIAYFGSPLLALFARASEGLCDNGNAFRSGPRLPGWLSWFQTFDNDLDGDGAWQRMEADHWAWRASLAAWPCVQAYLGRIGWLMRNPAYGFERDVLAASVSPGDVVAFSGDPFIQDKPVGREGHCYITIGKYWNLVYVKRFGDRCLKVNLGWKLKTYAENPARVSSEPVAQYVLSPRIASFS